MIKVIVFDSKEYDIESLNKNKNDLIEYTFVDFKLNKDTAIMAKGYDAVCLFVNDNVSKEVIDILYSFNIKAIFLRCAGFNNVDLTSAYKKIHIYRVPSYSPNAIAEYAFALLLTSNRRIHKAYNRTKEYNFSLEGLKGMDLINKTIGIIGTGKIGRCMIDIAKGFKMKVLAYDLYQNPELDVKYVSLDELLTECDIISLHAPLNDATYHLINKDNILKMKKGVMIINTSRGALIDTKALYEGLKERRIGAALLDVYEEEGDIFYNDRSDHILDDETLSLLISLPNVIVTSHQAFLTTEALTNIKDTLESNIVNFFNNKPNFENEVCYKCGKESTCSKKRNGKCF